MDPKLTRGLAIGLGLALVTAGVGYYLGTVVERSTPSPNLTRTLANESVQARNGTAQLELNISLDPSTIGVVNLSITFLLPPNSDCGVNFGAGGGLGCYIGLNSTLSNPKEETSHFFSDDPNDGLVGMYLHAVVWNGTYIAYATVPAVSSSGGSSSFAANFDVTLLGTLPAS